MFCREQVARVLHRRNEIVAQGAGLFIIGNGSVSFAQGFAEELAAQGHHDVALFTDPERTVFKFYGMQKSAHSLFRRSTLRAAARALRAGHRQTGVRGDALQNGGLVVLDEGGRPIHVHVEQHAGDVSDLGDMIRLLARRKRSTRGAPTGPQGR